MKTSENPVFSSESRPALRQRVVFSIVVAMLLMTLGAEAESLLRDTRGILSLAWPLGMLLLAIYWLRMFLSGWMRRFEIGECGDESV